MKKIKNMCRECYSIVDVKLVSVPEKWRKPIRKKLKTNETIVENIKGSMDNLAGKFGFFFTGIANRQTYEQLSRILRKHKDIVEINKKYLKYNYYYKCPVCKEETLLKIKNNKK